MSEKNIGLMLKVKSSKAAPKSKGGVPEIDGFEKKADQLAALYETWKQSEAEFRALEGDVLTEVDALYAKRAQNGQFSKSLNLPGEETNGMQVTYQNKFLSIPGENEEEIKKIMGDKFDLHFEQKRDLKLEQTDDKTIEMLMEKLGEETFFQIFSIQVSINPKGDMDRNQFQLPDAVRSYLKQYKASLKKR